MARRNRRGITNEFSEFNYQTSSPNTKRFIIKYLNQKQKEYGRTIQQNTIIFAIGSAGSGKTVVAALHAMEDYLAGRIDKIIVCRPVINAGGEQLGFLPGTLNEKMDPYTKPIFDVFLLQWNPKQIQTMLEYGKIEIAPLAFMRGRAQPLHSKIKTPLGEVPMGEICIGDFVLGSNGSPTKVTGVFPQGMKQIYRISFSDGTSTLASGDHLWITQTRSEKRHGKPFSVKTTEDIVRSKVWLANGHQRNHEVPIMSAPAEFSLESDLEVDPYLLGCLLGDGSLHAVCSIKFTTADDEMLTYIQSSMPCGMRIEKASGYDYRLVSNENRNPLKSKIKTLGLCGLTSGNKYVPAHYLLANIKSRHQLLQGLMDTDGTIWKDNENVRVQFSSTSKRLAEDVVFLVRSLGGIAFLRERDYSDEFDEECRRDSNFPHRHNSHVVEIKMPLTINPFRLSRKANLFNNISRIKRFIDEIIPIGEMKCQCISVEAEDHLYLTDDFIVTHNTFKNSFIILDEAQNATDDQLLMLLSRLGDNSKMVITGDPSQRDIGGRPFEKARRRLSSIPGIAFVDFTDDDVVRHPLVQKILRVWSNENTEDVGVLPKFILSKPIMHVNGAGDD